MIDWTQTAMLFPGQGSQEVGMGADLAAHYPAARAVFEEADALLSFALSRLCWEGPEPELNDTYNTQPALFVTSIAALRALEAEVGPVRPAFMAGHSLGELTALTAAGALSFADGLRLVRERGRLMQAAGEQNPGAMAAILGLEAPALEAICAQAAAETGQPLVLANDNCPGQIVISGDVAAIDRGITLATEAGAKRAVRLAVSIASHSPLMSPAQAAFTTALAAVDWHPAEVTVVGNVSAAPLPDQAAIRAELGAQLTSPVRWTESMQYLLQAGVTRFVEVGSGSVLSGLVRRIDRNAERASLSDSAAIAAFAAALVG